VHGKKSQRSTLQFCGYELSKPVVLDILRLSDILHTEFPSQDVKYKGGTTCMAVDPCHRTSTTDTSVALPKRVIHEYAFWGCGTSSGTVERSGYRAECRS
jgi:hypothetical protein